MKVKEFFKEFMRTRSVGFWLFIAALVLSLAGDIIYVSTYTDGTMLRYYSAAAFAIPLVAIIVSLAMSVFEVSDRWAALVLFGLQLLSFCLFMNATYMLLSSSFFGGVTFQAIMSLNIGFLLTTLLHVLVMIVAAVALFMGLRKKSSQAESGGKAETVSEAVNG